MEPNYMRNARPVAVEYLNPANNQTCLIHYNLREPENFARFAKLLVWASIHGVELTIKKQVAFEMVA